jgi:hypothetical protein
MQAKGDALLGCAYCGATEPMPPDLESRLALLRKRVDELRSEKLELDRMDRRVAGMADDVWLRGTLKAALGPLTLIVAIVVWTAIMGENTRDSIATMLGLVIQLVSVVGGMVLGFVLLARHYKKHVRPQILARVPEAPGSPARCRVCGGDLTAGHGIVECPWCRFTNFVGPELSRQRDALLAKEIDEYRRRQSGGRLAIDRHHARVRIAILVGNVAGMLLGVIFGPAIGRALAPLII